MPRPHKDSIRRWTRHGVDGYVKDVDGRAVSYLGHRKKALGFPFAETNRVKCLDLHAERVNAERLRSAARRLGVVDHSVVASEHTVADLYRRYMEMRMQGKTVAVHTAWGKAVDLALKGVETLRLSETDEIARRIARNLRGPSHKRMPLDKATGKRPVAPPIAPRTASEYLSRLRSLFRFGMQLGWCARNPIDIIEMPRELKDKSAAVGHLAIPYDIARRAIERVYAIDERAALFLELLLLTGMRDDDARSMRISQIHDDHILVISKGAAPMPGEDPEAHRMRKPRRIVPLWDVASWPDTETTRWQARIRAVVMRAREIARPTAKDWLFPAIASRDGRDERPMSGNYARARLRDGLTGLVDDPYDYTLHGLRKTAEHYMENVLELSPFDFCDITGHDINTYVKRYRQRRSAADIMRSISRNAGVALPVTEAAKLAPAIDRMHPHTGPQNRG